MVYYLPRFIMKCWLFMLMETVVVCVWDERKMWWRQLWLRVARKNNCWRVLSRRILMSDVLVRWIHKQSLLLVGHIIVLSPLR
jgi:hypothetical protein